MNVLMRRWIAAALIVAPVAWPALAGPPEDAIAAQEKRIQELEAEQARLKAEIEQIRKQQAPMPSPTPILTAPTPVSDRTPIPKPSETEPAGFTYKFGGRVKLDAIHDFDAIGSTENFDPRTIPVDGSEGSNTRLTATDSRMNFDINGPLEGRPLKLFAEVDFKGSSNVARLRHAYVRYGGLLVGQTWSNFMDEDNTPFTFESELPTAYALVRQGQIRWTIAVSPKTALSFAVEEPDPEVQVAPGVSGNVEKELPDFTAKLKHREGWGHVQASAFLGQARFRFDTGDTESETLWGVMGSGRVHTFGEDEAYAQLVYGQGIGRYRGGLTSMIDASGQLENLTAAAGMIGYQHYWSPRWSSNAVYSLVSLEDDVGDPAITNDRLETAAVNLRYWILPKKVWVGGEYLWGLRELRDGSDGSADRVMISFNFNLP